MVADKESKMRETLKIMGLGRGAYALSYLVMQGILTIFASLILLCALLYTLLRAPDYVYFIATDKGQCSALLLFIAILLFGFSFNSMA